VARRNVRTCALHRSMRKFVNAVAALPRHEEMVKRICALARSGVYDDEIARILTQEGHHSPWETDKVLPVTHFARSVYRAPLDRERFELPTPELVCSTGATADPEGTTEERVLSVWDLVWDF